MNTNKWSHLNVSRVSSFCSKFTWSRPVNVLRGLFSVWRDLLEFTCTYSVHITLCLPTDHVPVHTQYTSHYVYLLIMYLYILSTHHTMSTHWSCTCTYSVHTTLCLPTHHVPVHTQYTPQYAIIYATHLYSHFSDHILFKNCVTCLPA